MNNIKLSKNFWLSEFVKSQTAERLGINNWPTNPDVINNLSNLVTNVIQPIRDYYGIPFSPNSGYRCIELNRALGSKDSSQHVKGQAADIEISGVPNRELAEWIRDNLDFDQLIMEFVYDKEPSSGWVHVSYVSPIANRGQCLTINKHGTFLGFKMYSR